MNLSGSNRKALSPESRKTQRSQAASSDVVSNAPEEVDSGKVLESPGKTWKMSEERKCRGSQVQRDGMGNTSGGIGKARRR